ncbi:probable serine/threonine-protein kinase PBL7 [Euphorbia lathyris]|uniref:probable serine/threonine-protein kinase PBL7 n=1 Tax=Euphorbia lathyris TaxID=212925 RepID=UPI0033136B32
MKKVVKDMQKLHIVQQNANTWECCRMLDGVNEIHQSTYNLREKRVKYWQTSKWHRTRAMEALRQSQATIGFKSSIGEDNVIIVLPYLQLNMATSNFGEKNLIGKFQFGRVFRGVRAGKKVTVKIWETIKGENVYDEANELRLRDEISLLQHPDLLSHPNVVKMIGYSLDEGKIGAVYDLDPQDSLYNLAPKDEFSWLQRMKVIYEFANLLVYLHAATPPHLPYRVGNIDAAHIILDKEYSPKFVDFGMTVGGIILSTRASRMKRLWARMGYIDMDEGNHFEARDIFGFGCIILCLIHKRVPSVDFIPRIEVEEDHEEHLRSGNSNGFSYVHKSLKGEQGFNENDGVEITKLGRECVDICAWQRPSMEDVVKRLKKLHVIKKMGIKKLH